MTTREIMFAMMSADIALRMMKMMMRDQQFSQYARVAVAIVESANKRG
jgi:hypothetical protein